MSEKVHYFRPVEGRVCQRFGSGSFIGATRSPNGFVINTDVVVAITDAEIAPVRRAYANYLRRGDLKRATKSDYDAYIETRAATRAKVIAERKDAVEASKESEAPEAAGKSNQKPKKSSSKQ